MRTVIAVTDGDTPVVAIAADLLSNANVNTTPAGAPGSAAARVLIAGGFTTVNGSLLQLMPRLELVVRTGAGYDNVDRSALAASNVTLVAPRLEDDSSVAEYVYAGVLSLLRDLPDADRAGKAGDWSFRHLLTGSTLAGQTLGIVGVGRIGRQVAGIGSAFGMRVIAWHPWSERDLGFGITRIGTLRELLETADVVTLHCRLGSSTHHLIDAAALALMRPRAILVNTARGAIVDEYAVAQALASNQLRGAVIDVFDNEPEISRTPLRTAERVILTPHIAGLTVGSVTALATFAAETILSYVERGDLPEKFVVAP